MPSSVSVIQVLDQPAEKTSPDWCDAGLIGGPVHQQKTVNGNGG